MRTRSFATKPSFHAAEDPTFFTLLGNDNYSSFVTTSVKPREGLLFAGAMEDSLADRERLLIAKAGEAGNLAWANWFDVSREDEAYSLQKAADGEAIVLGTTRLGDSVFYSWQGGYHGLLAKMSNSSLTWAKSFSNPTSGHYDDCSPVSLSAADDAFIAAGTMTRYNPKNGDKEYSDGFVTWFDKNGAFQSAVAIGGLSQINAFFELNNVQPLQKNSALAVGSYSGSQTDPQGILVARINNNQLTSGAVFANTSYDLTASSMQPVNNSESFIAMGSSFENTDWLARYEAFFVGITKEGGIKWAESWGNPDYNYFPNSGFETSDGDFVFSGTALRSCGAGCYTGSDAFIGKRSAKGSLEWLHHLTAAPGSVLASSVLPNDEAGFLLTGETATSSFSNDRSIFVAELDKNAWISPEKLPYGVTLLNETLGVQRTVQHLSNTGIPLNYSSMEFTVSDLTRNASYASAPLFVEDTTTSSPTRMPTMRPNSNSSDQHLSTLWIGVVVGGAALVALMVGVLACRKRNCANTFSYKDTRGDETLFGGNLKSALLEGAGEDGLEESRSAEERDAASKQEEGDLSPDASKSQQFISQSF